MKRVAYPLRETSMVPDRERPPSPELGHSDAENRECSYRGEVSQSERLLSNAHRDRKGEALSFIPISQVRSRWSPTILAGSLSVVTVLVAALVLEALVRGGFVNRFILPPPSEVLAAFHGPELAELPANFLVTLSSTVAALCAALVVGVPMGWIFYRFELTRRVGEDFVAAMASAPLILLYPLFMVLFGRSILTVILMAALTALPPIILKTSDGLRSTRRVLVNVGRSFNLGMFQLFWKIELPAAAPTIFNGVRLGLMVALISIVAIEFLINIGGLGRMISDLADAYEIPGMYAMLFVVVVSMMTYYITEKVQKWLHPV
jgi:NitT/TauT family transport system permease protein